MLDMWLDLSYCAQLMDELNESAEALYGTWNYSFSPFCALILCCYCKDIYLAHGSQNRVKLPQPMVREVEGVARRKLSRPDLLLSSPQQNLLESMYNNEFQVCHVVANSIMLNSILLVRDSPCCSAS